MKKFQYQIVRYIHDKVTKEFVNVGIILYQPETNYLNCRFLNRYNRISNFFTAVNGDYLLLQLKQYRNELHKKSEEIGNLFTNFEYLSDITNNILPKDDSSLINSELLFGIDLNPDSALDDLFKRMVTKYFHEYENFQHDDSYVWRKVYKQYFDKYDITNKLKPHVVKTNHDEISFDKAWKNGTWNCFQTLSFEYKTEESIKNKVYKWSGKLNEIKVSKENLKIYFLTGKTDKKDYIKSFIEDTLLNQSSKTLDVKLIKEEEAERFVASMKEEIEKHNKLGF